MQLLRLMTIQLSRLHPRLYQQVETLLDLLLRLPKHHQDELFSSVFFNSQNKGSKDPFNLVIIQFFFSERNAFVKFGLA